MKVREKQRRRVPIPTSVVEPFPSWPSIAIQASEALQLLSSKPDCYLTDSDSAGLLNFTYNPVPMGEIIWASPFPAAEIRIGTEHSRDFPSSHISLDLLSSILALLEHHIGKLRDRDVGPMPINGSELDSFFKRMDAFHELDDVRAAFHAQVLIRLIHQQHYAGEFERRRLPLELAMVERSARTARVVAGRKPRMRKTELQIAKENARLQMPDASNYDLLRHLRDEVRIVKGWELGQVHWVNRKGEAQETPYSTFLTWAPKRQSRIKL